MSVRGILNNGIVCCSQTALYSTVAAVPRLFHGQGFCSFPVSRGFPRAAVLRVLTALFTLDYTETLEIYNIKVLSSIPSLWRKWSVGSSKFGAFFFFLTCFFGLIQSVGGAVRIEYCFFPALHCLNKLSKKRKQKYFTSVLQDHFLWGPVLCGRMKHPVWTHPVWF